MEFVSALRAKNLSAAFAESCTGGLCSKLVTDIPGSSDVFWGGVVSYSNDSKKKILRVSESTLGKNGAVSSETVSEMSSGLLTLSGADIAVAVSGIAGPSGGTPEKPVGLVWIGIAVKGSNPKTTRFLFDGDRRSIRNAAALEAFRSAIESLS